MKKSILLLDVHNFFPIIHVSLIQTSEEVGKEVREKIEENEIKR
jgi:hypothetical protein